MLSLTSQGKPLTDALTADTFMMTPPMMELYAFMDVYQVKNSGTPTDLLRTNSPDLKITVRIGA